MAWRPSAALNASVTARSIRTPIKHILQFLIREVNITVTTQETSIPAKCPTSTLSVQDFLVRALALRERGLASRIPEALSSLRLPDCLKRNGLHFFYWKTSSDCYRMTKAGHLKPSTPRLLKWGIVLNGVCLTADITFPNSENGCTLSDILMTDVPEKYCGDRR